MAIGYLPPALVRQNFRLLATSNSTQQLVAQHSAPLEFIVVKLE